MTTVTNTEELADEIAEAIIDTLDMDWQPSWAAPNIIAIINRERRLAHEAGAKAMQEAAAAAVDSALIVFAMPDANTSPDAMYSAGVRAIRALDPAQIVGDGK